MSKNSSKTIAAVAMLLCICTILHAQERVNASRTENSVKVEIMNTTAQSTKSSGQLSRESFEEDTFPPAGWKKATNFGGTGWARGNVGMDVPGFSPGSVFDAPPDGGQFVAFTSWLTGDADGSLTTGQQTAQWLITPRIMNVQNGDTLRFYLRYFLEYGDTLDVLISTTDDSTRSFTTKVATLAFSGPGNNEWKQYQFTLTDFVEPGSDIFIAFREHVANTSVEGDALFLDLVEVTSMVTAINERLEGRSHFQLYQNYPNPFNPETTIRYNMPFKGQALLAIYDLTGRRVAQLEAGVKNAGEYVIRWDGRDSAGNSVTSGIYFYRLEVKSSNGAVVVLTKKLALVK
ncbi:choice-of-anchor J domain-containing protein [candidate division KSB1 bacterium]|nr:choice-of-anchor J domain-containing protein [candidate division KSB1 bacterium]